MAYDRLSNYATTVAHDGNMMIVTYHRTVIVKWDSDKIVLNSNGYQTATTKKKMNQASLQFNLGYAVFQQASLQFNLGYAVFQKDYSWYVKLPNGDVVDFQDGMIIAR